MTWIGLEPRPSLPRGAELPGLEPLPRGAELPGLEPLPRGAELPGLEPLPRGAELPGTGPLPRGTGASKPVWRLQQGRRAFGLPWGIPSHGQERWGT
ncbi:MAG: hypothetical protein HQL98_14955 [Magnetococcales bacterium]|nr:hypothetical protein [Magnetococcales bacterium]